MAWLRSFKLMVRTSLTAVREKVENPERMIHQLIIDMEEELEQVKARVAAAIADEIQLGRLVERAAEESDLWQERAREALTDNEDSFAQQALEHKIELHRRVESLEREHREQRRQTECLERGVQDLQSKIRQARQRRTLLLARMTRARSQTAIHQAIDHSTGESAFAEFARLEDRVERAEATSAAYERLSGLSPGRHELEEHFARAELETRAREELDALRSSLDEDASGTE